MELGFYMVLTGIGWVVAAVALLRAHYVKIQRDGYEEMILRLQYERAVDTVPGFEMEWEEYKILAAEQRIHKEPLFYGGRKSWRD